MLLMLMSIFLQTKTNNYVLTSMLIALINYMHKSVVKTKYIVYVMTYDMS